MLLEQVPLLPTPSRGSSHSQANARNNGLNGPAAHLPTPSSASTSKNASDSPSPSATTAVSVKKRPPNDVKRKRSTMSSTPTDAGDPADHDPSPTANAPATKEKKKKASRACCHCQKAHLTCDDSRPCQRCVKRGIADTCAEGHRKKAKYLLDDDELEALKRAKEGKDATEHVPDPKPVPPPVNTTAITPQQQADTLQSATSNFMSSPLFPSSTDPIYNIFPDPSYPFDSTAANMEYSMLSAILGNPSAQDDAVAVPPSPPPSTTMANLPMLSGNGANSAWPAVPSSMDGSGGQSFGFGGSNGLPNGKGSLDGSSSFIDPSRTSAPTNGGINPATTDLQQFRGVNGDGVLGPLTPPASDPTPASPALPAAVSPGFQAKLPAGITPSTVLSRNQRSSVVYASVTKPFDYVDGYHYLMQYMQGRFDKMDILRIVRALAIFRPSLIALQMDLSDEDEIFAEKCFQRTLIELEKLISFSGTPTVVWRRTGEICLVGVEFTMLTEWTTDELVKKRKFIYELFEHQSVVEYWEKFASYAFEGSCPSVNCHCVLLKPSGEPIPCAFCFSIRRDVFDLPNVVIGQWLPLL